VFFAVPRWIGADPPIALRYPIKKIAAGITLLVLACYLLLSGAAIPTQRGLCDERPRLRAIIIDRLRISMRVCVDRCRRRALIEPASLVGVSFQMSFARSSPDCSLEAMARGSAAFAQPFDLGPDAGFWAGGRHHRRCNARHLPVFDLTLSSLGLYSPLANVIAVPLSAMWNCLGGRDLPVDALGLERLALVPMGWGTRHLMSQLIFSDNIAPLFDPFLGSTHARPNLRCSRCDQLQTLPSGRQAKAIASLDQDDLETNYAAAHGCASWLFTSMLGLAPMTGQMISRFATAAEFGPSWQVPRATPLQCSSHSTGSA